MTISTTVSATMVQSWHVSFVFNSLESLPMTIFSVVSSSSSSMSSSILACALSSPWISSAMPWMRSTAPSSCSKPSSCSWMVAATRAWDEWMKAVFCISRSPLASYAPRCDAKAACSSASIFARAGPRRRLERTRRRAWPCRRRLCAGSAPRRRCEGTRHGRVRRIPLLKLNLSAAPRRRAPRARRPFWLPETGVPVRRAAAI